MTSTGELLPKVTPSLARYLPEPSNRLGEKFGQVMQTVGSALSQGASFAGVDTGYQDLIRQQIEVQQQMQLVSLHSNIEKSKHETQMAPIRNIRAA